MDPNKTMDESSAEGKESEGKTEQVRKLLHAISLSDKALQAGTARGSQCP